MSVCQKFILMNLRDITAYLVAFVERHFSDSLARGFKLKVVELDFYVLSIIK